MINNGGLWQNMISNKHYIYIIRNINKLDICLEIFRECNIFLVCRQIKNIFYIKETLLALQQHLLSNMHPIIYYSWKIKHTRKITYEVNYLTLGIICYWYPERVIAPFKIRWKIVGSIHGLCTHMYHTYITRTLIILYFGRHT